jgi:uncharacterized protein
VAAYGGSAAARLGDQEPVSGGDHRVTADAERPVPGRAAAPAGGGCRPVLLGSDFPNIPYPYLHQLEALARLELGADWLRAVCHQNATALLSL